MAQPITPFTGPEADLPAGRLCAGGQPERGRARATEKAKNPIEAGR